MKTAISIPDKIFAEVEQVIKETKWSRSKVFTEAMKVFLKKHKGKKMLDAINEAYSDTDISEETLDIDKNKKYFAEKIIKRGY